MRSLAAIFIIGCALNAQAASFSERFAEANALQQSGNTDAALERYREMLVDYPDSEALRYAAASARHRAGRNSAAQGNRESADKAFAEAKQAFEELVAAEDAKIRAEAAFGAADTVVQRAILTDHEGPAAAAPAPRAVTAANAAVPVGGPNNYQQAVEAWRKAVTALEALVREYPDMQRARHNLDAARYRLKKLLQDPPDDQQQENPEEQPQNQPPPPSLNIFIRDAGTGINEASAERSESGDAVRLVLPDDTGERP